MTVEKGNGEFSKLQENYLQGGVEILDRPPGLKTFAADAGSDAFVHHLGGAICVRCDFGTGKVAPK